MPSLIAFGRRWNISSDDFVFPALSEALVRSGWVLAAIGLFFFHNPSECKSLGWFTYLGLLLVGNIVTILFCIAIAAISARGTILDMEKRRHIVTLIYCRVPLFIAEIVYTIVSAIFAFGVVEVDSCFSLNSLRITVGLELFLVCCVTFGIIAVFNPHGDGTMERSFMVERRYWQNRMIVCKFRQSDEMREALDEIASLLAAFFADSDYVISDVLAGLLLLTHMPEEPPSIQMQINTDNNFPDWMKDINALSRMLDFAIAVYGYPSYLFNNCSLRAWYRLWRNSNCCCCRRRKVHDNSGDNCCAGNTAAFLLEAKIEETDIFYISFRNRLYQVPFAVLADHKSQSIVVTIRGSASILDFVTDLTLNEDVFSVDIDADPVLRQDDELDSEGATRVHRGMLRSAHYVYNILKKNNVIEDLHVLYPSYQLAVCGHSLGAGVASLLTLLLKQTYPTVRCYAFSPPGCVISEHGIAESEQHILSVIVGDDIVPRISYQSLMHLKIDIDNQITTTTRAKYEILIKGIFKLFFSAPWDLHSDNSSADNRSCRRLISNQDDDQNGELENGHLISSSSSQESTAESTVERIRLYPPGRLLHLAFDQTTQETQANWIKQDYLKDIQLTGTILSDHMPHRVRKIIRRARDENFSI